MIDSILSRVDEKKERCERRYLKYIDMQVPSNVKIPTDPHEAMILGMRIATARAYGDGITDGAALAHEVYSEVALLMGKSQGNA